MLRGLFDAPEEDQQARIEELVRIVGEREDAPWSLGLDVPERDPIEGYASWSQTYDTAKNGLIDLEQPVVEEILAGIEPGRALDAACGTGRQTRILAARHDVTGVDQSPDMLAVAREAVPGATFVEGDLVDLGQPEGSFDLVVCSLALTHVLDLSAAVGELARVARVGGRLVLSDIHPMSVLTLGQGFYTDADGNVAFVRNHVHMISSYLTAFRGAGLDVLRCVEVCIPADARYGGVAGRFIPDAAIQATEGLPMALVWELEKR